LDSRNRARAAFALVFLTFLRHGLSRFVYSRALFHPDAAGVALLAGVAVQWGGRSWLCRFSAGALRPALCSLTRFFAPPVAYPFFRSGSCTFP